MRGPIGVRPALSRAALSRATLSRPALSRPALSRPVTFGLALALAIFVAGLCLQPISESDLFFRLKVGQEILARGGLLGRNVFSFTAPDHPDLDLAWAFEVGVALLYRGGGFAAVVVGKTAVIVAAFALAFAVCRRRGAGATAAAAALAGAAWVMRDCFVERPHVLSFLGEAVVLAALERLGHRWSRARGVGFFLAMVLWANGHAGLFTGVLMLALAGLAAVPVDGRRARRGLALAAAVAVAACLTPAGPGIGRYLALHVSLPRIHQVDEFRVATWRSDAPFFVWIAGVAAVVAWVERRGRHAGGADGAPGRGPAPPWRDAWARLGPELAPAVGMTALGFWSVRFSADAALVTAPILATRLSALLRAPDEAPGRAFDDRAAATPDGDDPRAPAAPRTPRATTAAAIAVMAALVVAALAPRAAAVRAGRRALDLGIDTSALPLAAIRFVEQHGLRARMYNDFEIGSYLAFEGYPRYRVFVDPRLPAYPEEMHRLLGAFDMDRATWDAAMARFGVDSALLAYAGVNRRVAWWDPERWALVFREADARVFVRRLPAWRALIAALEIPATFTFTVEEGAVTVPLSQRPAPSPVSDCDWDRRLGDLVFDLDRGSPVRARAYYEKALDARGCLAPGDEAQLAAWVGALALESHDDARAVGYLDRALAIVPGDTPSRANRATAQERAGRPEAAAADWARVAAEAPATPLGHAAAARARRLTR